MAAALSATDRRRWPRWPAGALCPMPAVRLRGGRDLALIDLSPGGMLVQGLWRLLPGSTVEACLTLDTSVIAIRGEVVRCEVAVLEATGAIQYRGALCFQGELSIHVLTGSGKELPGPQTPTRPAAKAAVRSVPDSRAIPEQCA